MTTAAQPLSAINARPTTAISIQPLIAINAFRQNAWADPRLPNDDWATLAPEWHRDRAPRPDYARRQALVGIDILAAKALGLTLGEPEPSTASNSSSCANTKPKPIATPTAAYTKITSEGTVTPAMSQTTLIWATPLSSR